MTVQATKRNSKDVFSYLYNTSENQTNPDATQQPFLKRMFNSVAKGMSKAKDVVHSELKSAFSAAKEYPILTLSGLVGLDLALMGGSYTQSIMLATGSALVGALVQSAVLDNSGGPAGGLSACEIGVTANGSCPTPA